MQPTEFYQKFLQSKYLSLLIAILFLILTMPIMDDLYLGKIIVGATFIFIIIGILSGLKGHRNILFLTCMGLIVLVLNLAQIEMKQLYIVSKLISILFYAYVIILFGKDICTSKQKTNDILLGAICIYLLIGICFALLYMILQSIHFDAIIHQASNAPISQTIDFYYFSFITLATVGFGDITVQSSIAKSTVIIESIMGLFYITMLVARLVALFNK